MAASCPLRNRTVGPRRACAGSPAITFELEYRTVGNIVWETSAFLLLLRTRPACLVIDRRLQITRCYRSKRHGRRYRKRTDQYRCDGAVGAQKTFVVVHRPTRQQQMLQAGRVRPASSLREARNLRHALNNAVGRLKDRLIDMAAQQLLQKAFAVLAVTFSAAAASWPRRGRRGTAARRGQSRRLRPRRSDARRYVHPTYFENAPRFAIPTAAINPPTVRLPPPRLSDMGRIIQGHFSWCR